MKKWTYYAKKISPFICAGLVITLLILVIPRHAPQGSKQLAAVRLIGPFGLAYQRVYVHGLPAHLFDKAGGAAGEKMDVLR